MSDTIRITKFECHVNGDRRWYSANVTNGSTIRVHDRHGAWACEPDDRGHFKFVSLEIAKRLTKKFHQAERRLTKEAA